MDRDRFDALARLVSTRSSRRSTFAVLLGALILKPDVVETAAQSKRYRRHKNWDAQRRNRERGTGGRKARKRGRRTGGQIIAEAARCCSRGACIPGPGKNLGKCCFEDADLAGQNFRGANLGQASLARAILTNANFSSANLGQTCFVDADLTGARFSGANSGTAIFCRAQTDEGEDNSGCDRGTPCCPACDDAHLCNEGELCCAGRCVAGDCCDNGEQSTCGEGELRCANTCVGGECCRAADCANETCRRRASVFHLCEYMPVFGEPGPRCTTICCENEQELPACCPDGTTVCTAAGLCHCRDERDCAAGEICCDGRCEIPIWANEMTFGSGPRTAGGEFERIIGVAVSGNERTAWVVDQGNSASGLAPRVSVWTRQASGDWDLDEVLGAAGDGQGQFEFPFGVAASDDGLMAWVSDQGNSRITVWRQQFDGSWTNTLNFGGPGDGSDEFDRPTGVAVSGDGKTAWVVDTGSDRVSIWTESSGFWTPLTAFGSSGNNPGQFSDVVGIAVSADGQTAWAVDRINTRVSVWTRQPNGTWVFDTEFGSFGDGADQFRGPLGVAVAADGQTAFVADLGYDRISIWTRQPNGDWAHERNFGSGPGDDGSEFDGPSGLAVVADGRTVWVSDADNHRVSIWSLRECPAPGD